MKNKLYDAVRLWCYDVDKTTRVKRTEDDTGLPADQLWTWQLYVWSGQYRGWWSYDAGDKTNWM